MATENLPDGLNPAITKREFRYEAEVVSVTQSLRSATVSRNGKEHTTFVSDEGPVLGGLGSAPAPLAYLTAAIAF